MSEGEKLHQILTYIFEKKGVSANTNEIAVALALTRDEAYQLTHTLIQNGDVRDCSSKDNHTLNTLDVFSIAQTRAAILNGKYSNQAKKLLAYYGPGVNRPTLFISYCWANQSEAETIYTDLTQIGVQVKKDTHDLIYKDNLTDFMRSIRDADYAIVLISDHYLKSKNCLNEVLHLLKEKEVKRKILPVLIEGTKIYSAADRLTYIQYWEEQKELLEQKVKKVNPLNALEVLGDLKLVAEIAGAIDSFLKEIGSILTVKFSDLKNENYLPLLTAMGYDNVNWATDLLEIIAIDSMEERDIALDGYSTKHQPNSYFYSLKGSTNTKSGRPDQAKQNYLQAIKLNNKNVEALNNLGLLFDHHYKQYQLAKEYYQAAIEADPKLTNARINLALLLKKEFNDVEGAKQQYETIISYDSNEVRAYNNLANLYRTELNDIKSQDTATQYLKKALEIAPTYLDTYINFGNLLKLQGKTDEGNRIYELGKQYDKTGNYTALVDVLRRNKKG